MGETFRPTAAIYAAVTAALLITTVIIAGMAGPANAISYNEAEDRICIIAMMCTAVVDRNVLQTMKVPNALVILLLILLTCIGTQFICGACHSPHVTMLRKDGEPNYPRTTDYVCDDCGAVVRVMQVEPNKKNIAI